MRGGGERGEDEERREEGRWKSVHMVKDGEKNVWLHCEGKMTFVKVKKMRGI